MTEWIPLYIPCPVSSISSTRSPCRYYHSDCGGSIRISTEVYLKCVNCGKCSHWKEWTFSCAEHSSIYKMINGKDFLNSLSIAMQPSGKDGGTMATMRQIIKKLMEEII
ncbi:hypothetical protein RclHR1_08970006 [Rhizophagus clarus]|uniref:Uncharacterized protein n=1 Tax=Rhizophagus clarus TaxID=94130 RepID=A0A2Z6S2T7_9GLOM|nr:hypothetical protein RclHR1_08970006 [Rhizophagus clarus]GES73521.1 hypothetical protein RCL2_000105100 [Rhizophagus clarus]